MHLLMFGSSLKKVDIGGCQNLDEIRSTIRTAAKARPDAKRIFCQGWVQATTDGEALASMIDDLDDLNRPIFIDAKDLHSAWCNTAALKELKVQDMPDPAGGEIHRDSSGNPSGLLSESAAVSIVWPHVANMASESEKLAFVREAVRAYNAAGYTGMIEMATDENIWHTVSALRRQEVLPVRLAMHWIIIPSQTDEENLAQVDRAIELHRQYNLETSPDFRIAGIKVICDGVVDACTASLQRPYSSNGISCDPLWPADMLKKVVYKADAAGLQCALHAIGDAAVKLAIDTLESLGTSGRRHRIEHLELTSPEDAKRLGRLGITASVQAVHADPAILKAWPKLIGEDRLRRAFAYKEFHDHGANLALGTDSPTAPHLPFPNLYTATTRRSARDPSMVTTTNKHFGLSLMEALTAATYGSAYSCFADTRIGELSAGKKADFVIADMDPNPDQLLRASVHETWFDGKRVFRN